MEARGIGQDPLLARFERIKTEALRQEQLRKAQGLPPPTFVDNPTPAELANRRFVATCDETNFDANHSGE